MNRILIVTDTTPSQLNGVVRTIDTTIKTLEASGWSVKLIHADMFPNIPAPKYPEIKLAISTNGLKQMMVDFNPTFVHIATEGRLGWAARNHCLRMKWKFSTAYHTDFPGYLRKNYKVPSSLTYRVLRRFHSKSGAVMVSTPTVEEQLRTRGFNQIVRWGRGVDTAQFVPRITPYHHNDEPVLLNVGRVSKEKNLEAFLDLDCTGMKIVVGEGPMLDEYRRRYPDVVFMGKMSGKPLAAMYAMADVFVFPSVNDTFGLVIIEALASGTPVAAFPVQGPVDILTSESGVLSPDLGQAISRCYTLDRRKVAEVGQSFSWERATEQFMQALVPR